jgi:glycosyltransferase involved in cell wall biosynthesis
MRILNVTQAYFPFLEKGGPAVKVRAIAERMAKRGHRVTVLTADDGLEGRDATFEMRSQRTPVGRAAEMDGVEALYLSTWLRYRALTLNPRLVPFCRKHLGEFDIVHIFGLYDLLGPALALYCRRAGTPYIVEPMGMFRPIVRNIRLKRLYHRWLGRKMLAEARVLVATSQEEARELASGGIPEAKIVVRRNGIELPEQLPAFGAFRRQWQISSAAKVVLFLGRLVPKKSPDLLLRALARSVLQKAGARSILLVLAGPAEDRGYREHLGRLAAELGLADRVRLTGPLYGENKWAAYRDADIFVLPSQSENFGNTVAEAIACGTPVIVTDRCGIAPMVQGRAGLVLPYEAEALAAALATLLDDDALRARLRDGCPQVARELSWDEPIALMENIYAQILAGTEAVEGIRPSPDLI